MLAFVSRVDRYRQRAVFLHFLRSNDVSTSRDRLSGSPKILPSTHVACRPFFSLPPSSLTKEYSERKLVGYSMDQFYDVVADVDKYEDFVPWCIQSDVFQRSDSHARANLKVGFPPVTEKYTSVLTFARPNLIRSKCMDGTIINHLTCDWKFSKGLNDVPNSCHIDFYIAFEFKYAIHSHLATMFFDQVVIKQVKAFEDRACTLYGPSSLKRKPPPRKKPPAQQQRAPPTLKFIRTNEVR